MSCAPRSGGPWRGGARTGVAEAPGQGPGSGLGAWGPCGETPWEERVGQWASLSAWAEDHPLRSARGSGEARGGRRWFGQWPRGRL